jgi:hypothetical protein
MRREIIFLDNSGILMIGVHMGLNRIIIDLFNNLLNQPVIVYETTNQSHLQGMPVSAMSTVWI